MNLKQGSLLRFPLSTGEVYRKLYMVCSKNHKPGKAAQLFAIGFIPVMKQDKR